MSVFSSLDLSPLYLAEKEETLLEINSENQAEKQAKMSSHLPELAPWMLARLGVEQQAVVQWSPLLKGMRFHEQPD